MRAIRSNLVTWADGEGRDGAEWSVAVVDELGQVSPLLLFFKYDDFTKYLQHEVAGQLSMTTNYADRLVSWLVCLFIVLFAAESRLNYDDVDVAERPSCFNIWPRLAELSDVRSLASSSCFG